MLEEVFVESEADEGILSRLDFDLDLGLGELFVVGVMFVIVGEPLHGEPATRSLGSNLCKDRILILSHLLRAPPR